jgi:hypothetical protein
MIRARCIKWRRLFVHVVSPSANGSQMSYQLYRLNCITRLVTAAVRARFHAFLTKVLAIQIETPMVSPVSLFGLLPGAPGFPEEQCVLKVPRLRLFVPVRVTCRWRGVWSVGGMILTGETGVLGENLSQRHCVHYKYHIDWPRIEPASLRWEAGDLEN